MSWSTKTSTDVSYTQTHLIEPTRSGLVGRGKITKKVIACKIADLSEVFLHAWDALNGKSQHSLWHCHFVCLFFTPAWNASKHLQKHRLASGPTAAVP